jgi:phosphatidylglycerol:prolipoprotein diacylglycerol transferase
MTFPVQIHFAGYQIPAHPVMEVLAYAAGFQIYLWLRRRRGPASLPLEAHMWIIVGCVFGALLGSKILAWAESPMEYWAARSDPRIWLGGKTIVGGLLGGWIGVEIAKKWLGVARSTGDLFVFPLIVGMCIGRVGCFLTGLPDRTYGVHTSLPWGVDFGDGPRHPAQLYEIGFLMVLGVALSVRNRRRRIPPVNGELFRLFMLGYLSFRFLIEFIKPSFKPYLGLSAIQVASLAGSIVCLWQLRRAARPVTEVTIHG